MADLQRFGKNIGGYFGERIDIRKVLDATVEQAVKHGWEISWLEASPAVRLLSLRRLPRGVVGQRRLYLSSGIHGDEPAGPLAVLQLLTEDRWPADAAIWICPCLNPTGFERGTRENAEGIDLNRDYRHLRSAEVRTHVRWLERQPDFDLALCLHEDWEAHGFYIYEINPDEREPRAARIIQAVAPIFPIDESPSIDGWEASAGVISAPVDLEQRPLWAEALYLHAHRARHTCTLETPSDFPLEARVRALATGAKAAVNWRPGALSA